MEVHIGHPEGYYVTLGFIHIPLKAVGIVAVDGLAEKLVVEDADVGAVRWGWVGVHG